MTNHRTKSWGGATAGFTLLEILIAGVLVSVLMVGVWSLFRSWGNLYERGERRVQTAQLVRSLCDQFTDDVRAVAYVAPPPRRPSRGEAGGSPRRGDRTGSSAGGNLALVGEANWLVLEVLQPPNPYLSPASADETRSDEDAGMALAAPELQRVMYSFEPPASQQLDSLSPMVAEAAEQDDTELVVGDDEETAEPFAGLLRLAVAVEQFDALAAGNLAAGNRADQSTAASLGLRDAVWQLRELIVGPAESDGLSGREPPASLGPQDEETSDATAGILEQDAVPEVVRLEFRYFDGAAWRSSWNSQSEGRLPVAMELRFELKKPEPLKASTSGDGETELVEGADPADSTDSSFLPADAGIASSSNAAADSVDSDYEATPYHRCVVYLEPAPEQPPAEPSDEPVR